MTQINEVAGVAGIPPTPYENARELYTNKANELFDKISRLLQEVPEELTIRFGHVLGNEPAPTLNEELKAKKQAAEEKGSSSVVGQVYNDTRLLVECIEKLNSLESTLVQIIDRCELPLKSQ